jgi:hypothetical protein
LDRLDTRLGAAGWSDGGLPRGGGPGQGGDWARVPVTAPCHGAPVPQPVSSWQP